MPTAGTRARPASAHTTRKQSGRKRVSDGTGQARSQARHRGRDEEDRLASLALCSTPLLLSLAAPVLQVRSDRRSESSRAGEQWSPRAARIIDGSTCSPMRLCVSSYLRCGTSKRRACGVSVSVRRSSPAATTIGPCTAERSCVFNSSTERIDVQRRMCSDGRAIDQFRDRLNAQSEIDRPLCAVQRECAALRRCAALVNRCAAPPAKRSALEIRSRIAKTHRIDALSLYEKTSSGEGGWGNQVGRRASSEEQAPGGSSSSRGLRRREKPARPAVGCVSRSSGPASDERGQSARRDCPLVG